jgi:two-component system response regulator MprA
MLTAIGNVLVVDDDGPTRELLATLLSAAGFHAVVAEDGLEALHVLRTLRRRAPEAPCLVLLDLSIPRLGGPEFRRAQLSDARVAAIPVAVVSGAVDLEQRARSMGAVAAVAKPIDCDVLLDVVRRHCVLGGVELRAPADRLANRRRENGA